MHALIVGERKVGKSTLIRRVLADLEVSVGGFETKKEEHLEHPEYGNPIYIYEAGQPHEQTDSNLAGYCKQQCPRAYKEVFDQYAEKLQLLPGDNNLILMDEIGFMETCSDSFCGVILSLLDGDTPVIAAVKDKDTPFLNTVRSNKNCRCFYITKENRDELAEEVLAFMQQQFADRKQAD